VTAIFNEIDGYAAQWTRNLIAAGHVALGVVDERSIADLRAVDVSGPGQRHFFAGIGVWSYALRLAGVRDDADVWTGSCPCQGLSDAGRKLGFADPRHLWPVWFELIRECRPRVILGEQVASGLGLEWLDLVCADLEGAGYTVRAADTCAAGFGAPHIRQRIYFVAYAEGAGRPARRSGEASGRSREPGGSREVGELGHADELAARRDPGAAPGTEATGGRLRGLADGPRPSGELVDPWRDAEWVDCADGKRRPVGAGVRPLVDGAATGLVRNRAAKLKGYGNAIVSRQAAAFIAANLDVIQEAA
jgi:DNA (cytosine-5)-methyltransferase 1